MPDNSERPKLPRIHPLLTSKYDHPEKWPSIKPIAEASPTILETASDIQRLFKPSQNWQPEAFHLIDFVDSYELGISFLAQYPPVVRSKFRLPWLQTLLDLPSTLIDPSIIIRSFTGDKIVNSYAQLQNHPRGPYYPLTEYKSRPGIRMTAIVAFPLFFLGSFVAEDSSRLTFLLTLEDALPEFKQDDWITKHAKETYALSGKIGQTQERIEQLHAEMAEMIRKRGEILNYTPTLEEVQNHQLLEKLKSLPIIQ